MKLHAISVFLCLVLLGGCEQPSTQSASATQQQPVKQIHKHPTHRFENVSPTGGLGVALDTVTGQWCRTWEWDYKESAERYDLNTLPLCKSLYESDPADD